MMSSATIVATAAAALLACGSDDPGAPATPDAMLIVDAAPGVDANQVTHSYTLAGGVQREPTLELAAGASIRLRYTSSASPIAWNVHTHAGGGTTILDEGDGATLDVVITAAASGEHYLLLANGLESPTTTVDVTLELGPGASLTQW